MVKVNVLPPCRRNGGDGTVEQDIKRLRGIDREEAAAGLRIERGGRQSQQEGAGKGEHGHEADEHRHTTPRGGVIAGFLLRFATGGAHRVATRKSLAGQTSDKTTRTSSINSSATRPAGL